MRPLLAFFKGRKPDITKVPHFTSISFSNIFAKQKMCDYVKNTAKY